MTIKEVAPAVKAIRLGAELLKLREERELKQRDVAGELGWDAGRLSKIENVRVPVSAEDVAKLLDLYEVKGAERDELLSLTKDGRRKSWVRDYARFMDPVDAQYAALEAEASLLREGQWHVPPGLLQSQRYRRKLLEGNYGAEQVHAYMEMHAFRTARLRTEPLLHVQAIIGEAIRTIDTGGKDVMSEQFEHLIEMSKLPNVEIRIIPQAAGRAGVLLSGVSILEFPDAGDPKFAFLETIDGFVFRETPHTVSRIERLFDGAAEYALSPEESVDLMKEWIP